MIHARKKAIMWKTSHFASIACKKKSSSFLSVVTNLTLLTNDATFLNIISSNIIIITTNYF